MGWFRHPFHPALPFFNSFHYLIGDGIVRSFLATGPQVDLLAVNTQDDGSVGHAQGEYLPRVQEQSVEDAASLADLSPFEQHGGKLLLVHGVADSTIPTDASVLLYTRIVGAMGEARANNFVRLYLIPGFGHGRGVFFAGFDTVGVLDRWSNESEPPTNLVAVDQNKHAHRRERPMCAWPEWPRYLSGDVNVASSYLCTLDRKTTDR